MACHTIVNTVPLRANWHPVFSSPYGSHGHRCCRIPPRALVGPACLHCDRIFCPSSGPEAGTLWHSIIFVSPGGTFYALLANLSEDSSHKGDHLSAYCIKSRSQHKFVLFPCLALLWALLRVLRGAFCNWVCVVAGLTCGLGGWAGVMFSLRMGIGGRNRYLVGGGLRNELFRIAKKILVSGAYVRTQQRAPRHGERSETLFSPEAAGRAGIAT